MLKPSDYFRLLLLAAIWGASFLFMRIVAPVMGAIPTAFFRVLLGAIGLAAILAILRAPLEFRAKLLPTMALGVINSGIPFLMYSVAAKLLPAGYSAIINATTPLMGVVIGLLFFGEHITVRKTAGVLLGLAGVAALTATGPISFSPTVIIGASACLVATACYATAGFLTRKWITEQGGLDSKLVAFGSQVGASIFLLPFFAGTTMLGASPSWGYSNIWLALAALGLICTAAAYILYFRLIADVGPIRSLTVTFLIPPFGVLWGALFLDEQLSWAHLVGGSFICIAVWLVLSQSTPAASSKTGPRDGRKA